MKMIELHELDDGKIIMAHASYSISAETLHCSPTRDFD